MATNVLLDSLLPASFRGVPFLFQGHSVTRGRRGIEFEFVSKDYRYIEDIGKELRTYKITGYINSENVDYILLKDALIDALETEGSGDLIHPYDGLVTCFPSQFTLSESLQEFGLARFEMTFKETGAAIYPAIVSSYASLINAALGILLNYLEQDFPEFWSVTSKFVNNFSWSKSLVAGSYAIFTDAPNNVTDLNSNYSTFSNNLSTAQDNINIDTFNGSSLVSTLNQLFDSLFDITDTTSEKLNLAQLFFNYSTTDSIDPTTMGLEQRAENQAIFNQYMNAIALSYAFTFTSEMTFETQDDVKTQSDLLNTQYLLVIENNIFTDISGNQSLILSSTTINQLKDMRTNTQSYLDDQYATAKSVITLTNIGNTSLNRLVYQYYGSLDLRDEIFALNDNGYVTGITGSYKMLSDS